MDCLDWMVDALHLGLHCRPTTNHIKRHPLASPDVVNRSFEKFSATLNAMTSELNERRMRLDRLPLMLGPMSCLQVSNIERILDIALRLGRTKCSRSLEKTLKGLKVDCYECRQRT